MTGPSAPRNEPPNYLMIVIVMTLGIVAAAVFYGLVLAGVISR